MDQVMIGLLGVSALLCSQSRDVKIQRWCCILGLLAQPFWVYTTYMNSQFGVLFLCVAYTFGYLYGLYNFWLKDRYGISVSKTKV